MLVYLIASLLTVLAIYMGSVAYVCGGCGWAVFYCSDFEGFYKLYEDSLRGHLFSGFLALSGFLISLKAFIVVTMKEKVYDNPKYIDRWRQQRKFDSSLTLYGPLKELSDHLYYAISASLVAAVSQVTIGLFSFWWAALVCIFLAIFATSLLFSCLVLMKQNLDDWFTDINDH
ncbi:MAG: hypothetical protein ACQEXI_00245 [Pseudomonadota bacterium]